MMDGAVAIKVEMLKIYSALQKRTRLVRLERMVLYLVAGCCLGGLLFWSPALSQDNSSAVRFVDVTQASGITFQARNSGTPRKYLIETMIGGVGVLDYDNDGWLDIFFVNGARLKDPQPDGEELDKSAPEFWNRLYHNNHDGTFTDVTEKAGMKISSSPIMDPACFIATMGMALSRMSPPGPG
jgi:hypothetical protein